MKLSVKLLTGLAALALVPGMALATCAGSANAIYGLVETAQGYQNPAANADRGLEIGGAKTTLSLTNHSDPAECTNDSHYNTSTTYTAGMTLMVTSAGGKPSRIGNAFFSSAQSAGTRFGLVEPDSSNSQCVNDITSGSPRYFYKVCVCANTDCT